MLLITNYLSIIGILVGPWLFGRMIRKILDKKPYILESVLLGVFGGSLLNVIYQFLAWGNVVWTR